MKYLDSNPKFDQNRTRMSGTLHEDLTTSYCCRRQCKRNALLCCHSNNGYAKVTQYRQSFFFKSLNQFTVTTDDPKQCVKDQQNESAHSPALCLDGSVLKWSTRKLRLEWSYF